MLMKISQDDYNLLVAMVEFHFKFSEYVRESDSGMFYRALDYAKTYTNSNGTQFDYWHDNNPKFLEELLEIFIKLENSFKRLVNKVGDEDKAKQIWMKKKKTNPEDFFGIKKYLSNFIHHSRELHYEDFSLEDWENYVKICNYVTNDDKFIEFAYGTISQHLGCDHDITRQLRRKNENSGS